MKSWTSLTALLPLSHSSNPDQMPHFKKNKQRKEKNHYCLWNKLETCFWWHNSHLIEVNWCFPSSFLSTRIRLMGKGNSIQDIGRFWMGALVSSCHVSRCAWHPPRPLQHLQGQPGCSRHSPQAGLQQTSPRGDFGQTQPAPGQDNSWSQKPTCPGACSQHHPPQTAKSALGASLA